MLWVIALPFPRGGGVPGAPDPPTRRMISNPRVYARVQVAETAMASACADGMPTLVTSQGRA